MRLVLIGFGAVHRHFCRILLDKAGELSSRYGITPVVVGAADSGGGVYQEGGLDLAALLAHKQAERSLAAFPSGQQLPDALTLAQTAGYDFLLEASPVNLVHGDPGLSCTRAALERGRPVVLANKAPLVLDYAGLHSLAAAHGARLGFSATVCGGLPVVNVGRRDLAGATVHKVEGIFNSTTNYILGRMAAGESYALALAEAQRRGIAETDPTLDVEGWDTANKLVIIANAILGQQAGLAHVKVRGIAEMQAQDSPVAQRPDQTVKLIARAEQRPDGSYSLSVGPEALPGDHFLAGVSDWQMGIIFYTDIYEDIYLKIDEKGPLATAAAMLRDVLDLSGCLDGHEHRRRQS